ncbi:MAG TPA: HAMP domain-containing protein [Micromonosporaceae bacterium]|nr:HAMP domain-containing protein [Micromonosporaceae bacterium]
MSHEQLVAWRRRALDQQLPTAAFPAGSGKPSLVYLWVTMFLGAAIVLGFALNHQRGVPPAVVESQQDNVSKVASSIQLTAQNSIEDLDRLIATRSPSTPDPELLKQVVADGKTWSGAAVVETPSRRPLATHGTGLPIELLPPTLAVDHAVPITTADGPFLVHGTALDSSRTLLAMHRVTMNDLRLNPEARQGVFVITPDGKNTLLQGVNAVDQVHLPVVFQRVAQSASSEGYPVRVTEWPDKQLVVASAPVGETGAKVTSLIVAEVAGGTSTKQGFLLGLTLLATAVPSFLLMRAALVRPVRTLLRQAKADACGDRRIKRPRLRVGEAHRIARALALTSGGPESPSPPRRRWRPTVMHALAAATVLALLWPAAALATTLRAPAPPLPDQLVRDEESRAEAASNLLGNALNNGLQTVIRISEAEVTDPAHVTPVLERELADKRRFRGLYLVDPSGSVVSSAGREPLRSEPLHGEAGIDLDDKSARVPVVYAFRVAANGFAVVGEYDIDYLLEIMREVDGHARVVDKDLRTVFDSEGFRAFQELQGSAREAAREALQGGAVGRAETSNGSPALIAAASLAKPNTVTSLKWSVVVEQDLASLRVPESDGRRWTLLVAGAAVGAVVLTQVWQYCIFARPLRRLAKAADEISNGSVEAPIPPQRHDDIGALAMCLEICRQVQHAGSTRLGGATRMRGTEEDRTAVLTHVPQQPAVDRAAQSPGDRAEGG